MSRTARVTTWDPTEIIYRVDICICSICRVPMGFILDDLKRSKVKVTIL